jgi:quercetin dioxygenase-like cupin family protein
MSAIAVAQGRIVRPGEGKSYWALDNHVEIKAPTLWEFTVPPGCEYPLHVHRQDDELHYLIEGTATYTVGQDTLEAGPGDLVFLPQQVPHALVFGEEGGRWLWLTRPELAGLPDEVGIPADEPNAQARALEVPWEQLVEVFAKYGMDFIDPDES